MAMNTTPCNRRILSVTLAPSPLPATAQQCPCHPHTRGSAHQRPPSLFHVIALPTPRSTLHAADAPTMRRRDCPTTDTTGIRHPSRAAVNGPPRCRAPSLPRRAKGCGAPSPPRSAQRGPRDPCAGESTIYHKDVAAGEPAPPRRRSRHSSRATSAATSEHVRWRRGVPVGHASITPSTDIILSCLRASRPRAAIGPNQTLEQPWRSANHARNG